MIQAERPWLLVIAFIGSSILAGPVLVLWGLVVGYGSLFLGGRNHVGSGIYAVADGFSERLVLLVMLLCGIAGAIVAHFRLRR